MTGEEVRHDTDIANLIATQLFMQDPAEMNHGVPAVPARSLGKAVTAQPQDQPNRLGPERGLLPANIEQPVPERFVHLHLHDL